MDTTVAPATRVLSTVWTNVTISRSPEFRNATLEYPPHANLSFCQQEFLGDAEGNPVASVRQNQNPDNRYLQELDLLSAELLGELVTRADGSTLSIYSLLDTKLSGAVAKFLTQPAPTFPA